HAHGARTRAVGGAECADSRAALRRVPHVEDMEIPDVTYETLETGLDRGIARIWLNRPDVRNAMNEIVIAELTDAFDRAIGNREVRAIVLAGRGSAFCAGGDLNWMKRARAFTPEQNHADAAKLARMLRTVYESPKPTVAR